MEVLYYQLEFKWSPFAALVFKLNAQQHNNTMTEVAAIIKQGTYPWYLT